MSQEHLRALRELERRFAALEPRVPDGPQKEAVSVLHEMIMEVWRGIGRDQSPGPGLTSGAPAWLDAQGPGMDGAAVGAPLAVGSAAPDFALPDASGATVRLSDLRGRPAVLVFYPLDWSPGSSRQLDLLQQEVAGFDAREARPVGISVDSVFSHRAWAAARGITFPLLADFHPKGEVARRYGVWREADGFSERALYVLDAESRITHAHVSPFLHRLPAIDDVLAALDGARVETAGWEPAVVEELTG